jgi:urea carboxylase-associated protein 1
MMIPDPRLIADFVIPAGGSWSGIVRDGETFRIIDAEGQQAVDFICFSADDSSESYDSTVTIRICCRPFLNSGDVLYSNKSRPMFRIISDSVGQHDTVCGCCSAEINFLRYGVKDTPSCRANFLRELRHNGLDGTHLVPNINFFMNIVFDAKGAISFQPPRSKAGDYVDLKALMDALIVISNCPQTLNPANNFNPTPVRLMHFSAS